MKDFKKSVLQSALSSIIAGIVLMGLKWILSYFPPAYHAVANLLTTDKPEPHIRDSVVVLILPLSVFGWCLAIFFFRVLFFQHREYQYWLEADRRQALKILSLIFENPLSISELADVMQISEGTVLVFINELLNYQMISQADGGKYQPTFKGRSLIRLDKSHHG